MGKLFQPRILCPVKLSNEWKGRIKTLSHMESFKEFPLPCTLFAKSYQRMICPKTVNQKQYHTQEKGQGNSQGSSCATGLVNNQSIGKKIGGVETGARAGTSLWWFLHRFDGVENHSERLSEDVGRSDNR